MYERPNEEGELGLGKCIDIIEIRYQSPITVNYICLTNVLLVPVHQFSPAKNEQAVTCIDRTWEPATRVKLI